jgi:hypothetical protein
LQDESFTRQQLYGALCDSGSRLSYNSMGGVISGMMASGSVERIGRNRYVFTNQARAVYAMPVSGCLADVISSVTRRYSQVEFIAWDTLTLNEFLNHQIANSTIFIEVEPMLEGAVFEHLREACEGTVLLKPDPQAVETYWEPGVIIVQKLISQSPGDKAGSHLPTIENIIVELFANKLLRTLYSAAELPFLLEQMFDGYVIDENRLLRYAGRRNCRERIVSFIQEQTSVKLRYPE